MFSGLLAALLAAFVADGAGCPEEAQQVGESSIEMTGAEYSPAAEASASVTMLIVNVAGRAAPEEDLAGDSHG